MAKSAKKSETKSMLVQFFKSVSGLVKLFNVILAVISFICVSAVCSTKSNNGSFNLNFCHQDELHFGYIIWKIFIIVEILLSTCILFFFLFVPALRYNEKLNLAMMLYNLIQSIAHIYIWMVGTLNEDPFKAMDKNDKEYQDLIIVQIAIIVTQTNGILYFLGVFVYGDGFTTILAELAMDDNKTEMAVKEQHSSFNIASQPDSMIVSEEQTAAGSEVETAVNSVDASDNQMAK